MDEVIFDILGVWNLIFSLGQSKSVVIESPSANAREAARIAKLNYTAEKRRRTTELKEKWAREKDDKLAFFAKKREDEAKQLKDLESKMMAQKRRDSAKKREIDKKIASERSEMLKANLDAQTQLKFDLQRQEKERRRQSVALNKEIIQKSKQKELDIKRRQKEEEDSLLTSRRIDFLSMRENRELEKEERRKSTANRIADSRRQKELEEEFDKIRKEQEAEILQKRKDDWEDTKRQEQSDREGRRQSLACRLDCWRKQKKSEEETHREMVNQLEVEYSLRKMCWQDVQEVKEEGIKRDRLSLLWRLDKWREERDIEEGQLLEQQRTNEIERQLLKQEIEDVLAYRAEQEDLRRRSLAYRADSAARERDYWAGQDANRIEVIAAEMKIRQEDSENIRDLRAKEREERRASLMTRREQAVRFD